MTRLFVDHLDATEALRRVAEITFDHHETHEDFIRLVSIENVHHAEHRQKSDVRAGLAAPALDVIGGQVFFEIVQRIGGYGGYGGYGEINAPTRVAAHRWARVSRRA